MKEDKRKPQEMLIEKLPNTLRNEYQKMEFEYTEARKTIALINKILKDVRYNSNDKVNIIANEIEKIY